MRATLNIYKTLALLSIFIGLSYSQSNQVCSTKEADIVFLLDSSTSEGQTNFQKQVDFVKDFVKQFDIGPTKVQVGVVTFATTPHNEFWLNDFRNKADLLYGLSSIKYSSGETYTEKALTFAKDNSFSPSHGARGQNIEKLLIVLTDGQSLNSAATVNAAKQVHNQGIHTISIGIGSGVNQHELQSIATDPSEVFTVQNFNVLSSIQKDLSQVTCNTTTTTTEKCRAKADIAFVLDSSGSVGSTNFDKQLNFVKQFVKSFPVSPTETQFSVLTFSSGVYNQFFFNDIKDVKSLVSTVNNISYTSGSTYTGQALNFVTNTTFMPQHGARNDSKHIVIVMTDGRSTYSSRTQTAANALHKTGVEVMSIGIGTSVSTSELQTIATDNQHVFQVNSFDALTTIQSELEKTACNVATVICRKKKADIVFVLDASSSIGATDFSKQLDFVQNFTKKFDISPNQTQFSVVSFSDRVYDEFTLNKYQTKSQVLGGIGRIAYHRGNTYTNLALAHVANESFSVQNGGRPGVSKIVIVMTDGQSTSSGLTVQEANRLHKLPIKPEVIAIGISNAVRSELDTIATDPSHVFTVNNFDALTTIQSELEKTTCKADTTTTTSTTTTTTTTTTMPTTTTTVTTIPTTEESVCRTKEADIVFLLDSSTSEGQTDFQKQVDFVKDFVKQFDIGPNKVQVGAVTFATTPHNEFWLNDFKNKADLLYGLSSIKYSGGDTYTEKALTFAKNNSFGPNHGARGPSVEKLLIVLTDGKSLHSAATVTAAKQVHNQGIHTISIGIGSGVNQHELQSIATDPSEVFTVQNFNVLSSIQKDLAAVTCNTTTTPAPERVCGDEPADIVFILDSSGSEGRPNFQKELDFVGDFSKQFQIGPNGIQIGMVTFSSTARNDFYFNTYHDQQSLSYKLKHVAYLGDLTKTDLGLQYARINHFQSSTSGARKNAKKIAIVMTDGQSDSQSNTLREAQFLKNIGVNTIAIGIGSNINQAELQGIASDKQQVFNVSGFDALKSIVQELKDKACEGTTPPPTIEPACVSKQADILFLLDSSGSETLPNFKQQLDLVKTFSQQFKIGPNNIQIGLATFSTTVNERIKLNQYQDKQSLINALPNVPYDAGMTNTDAALKYARVTGLGSANGGRPNAIKIVVVMTDGKSNVPNNTVIQANLLKSSGGVKVIAIGIGQSVDKNEIKTIATDSSHAFTVADFDLLDSLKSELTYAACQTCGYIEKADIIFALDASGSEGSSNFQKQLDFVSSFVKDFPIGPKNVQFSLVTFSDSVNNEFFLKQYSDKTSLLNAVQRVSYTGGATHTEAALEFIRTDTLLPSNGARPTARHFVIVMTDGQSTLKSMTLSEATKLKNANVTVLAIGIGSGVDKAELSAIASDSQHTFSTPTFDALTSIKSEVKEATCENVVTTQKPITTILGKR